MVKNFIGVVYDSDYNKVKKGEVVEVCTEFYYDGGESVYVLISDVKLIQRHFDTLNQILVVSIDGIDVSDGVI